MSNPTGTHNGRASCSNKQEGGGNQVDTIPIGLTDGGAVMDVSSQARGKTVSVSETSVSGNIPNKVVSEP